MAAMSIPTPVGQIDNWAVGLCDAALALCAQIEGQDHDLVQALETFEGRQRALFDDLSEQVLRQQPAPLQAFLRQTAVLGRFSAELCDAVLESHMEAATRRKVKAGASSSASGLAAARQMLDELERAKLFIVPLDDQRCWYRYSRRFADFLTARLSEAERQRVHRKASAWFEVQGLVPEALEHALAAKDLATATRLMACRADTPARLKLQLFGAFELTLAGLPVSRLYSNKVQAVLIYLALQPNRTASRETLVALFWGEYPEQQAQASLRNTLSKLKHILGTAADQMAGLGSRSHPAPLLSITRQAVQLTLDPAQDWIDVLTFDDLLARCRAHAHPDVAHCTSCRDRLSQAVALYRADILAGWTLPDSPAFDEWRLLEQEQRQRQVLAALDVLIGHHAALGDFDQVQQYARRQLAFEPWHEQAHWHLMRALAATGERATALAQYESYRTRLWVELAAEPEPAIQNLADQIRTAYQHGQHTVAVDSDKPTPPQPQAKPPSRA